MKDRLKNGFLLVASIVAYCLMIWFIFDGIDALVQWSVTRMNTPVALSAEQPVDNPTSAFTVESDEWVAGYRIVVIRHVQTGKRFVLHRDSLAHLLP